MLHSILSIFSYDTHTVHGAWAIIGTVVVVIILILIGLRFLRPVSADQFEDHELEALLVAHAETSSKMPTQVVDA